MGGRDESEEEPELVIFVIGEVVILLMWMYLPKLNAYTIELELLSECLVGVLCRLCLVTRCLDPLSKQA